MDKNILFSTQMLSISQINSLAYMDNKYGQSKKKKKKRWLQEEKKLTFFCEISGNQGEARAGMWVADNVA